MQKNKQKPYNTQFKPVNDKSYTGWTSDGHTGEDVNTYAYGPRSESFSGNIENTESAKIIFDIFK